MAASTIHFYFFISFFAAFHSFGGREAGKGGEGGKGGTERGRKAPSSATLRRHPQAPPHGAVIVLSRWYHPLAGSCRHFVIVLLIVVWRGGSAAISRRPGATRASDAVAQPIPAPFRSEPMAAGSEQRPQSPANMAAHAG